MKIFTALVFVLATVSAFAQQSINFGSPVPAAGTYSTSGVWNTSGGFVFELGVFNSGFTPTAGNVNEWAANWSVANQGGPTGTATWIDDGGDTGFTGSGRITVLSAPFTGNTQMYLWGYDSKAAGSRQWILLSNTAWLVSTDISAPVSSNFTVNGSTSAVLGGVSNAGATLQSALVNVSAVPEPATYAGLFGLAALGFCAVRRRRKA
ncbi:MAG TPA: PEP-CTERM sorting domain-containing protein [Verrucomicrobiae bacterium]|nr:PEP-CTERM sorting domain-containing protein [Verrucomicrobiae bacterium]